MDIDIIYRIDFEYQSVEGNWVLESGLYRTKNKAEEVYERMIHNKNYRKVILLSTEAIWSPIQYKLEDNAHH